MAEYIFSFVAAIVLLPFFCIVLLSKVFCFIFTGESIFYLSLRLGKYRKAFVIYKFSTMKQWSNHQISRYLQSCGEQLAFFNIHGKIENDPRITRIGKFLRRFSLDELPQIINLLKGNMVLVGPRPICRREDLIYGKYSNLLHSVKPGITGLWQVMGRNTTTYHRRIAINIYYVKHKSWKLDLWILYKTVWAVIGGRGAY